MLLEFIQKHREELIERARVKVLARPAPRPRESESTHGVPLFLSQLEDVLRVADSERIGRSASDVTQKRSAKADDADTIVRDSSAEHGSDLLRRGFTIAQVVHDYGDVCQAVTELAVERAEDIDTEDFRTLNRSLDNAIASAVSEYARGGAENDRHRADEDLERQGFFAHELRNRLNTALLAFQSIETGRLGVTGSTMQVLKGSLLSIRTLIDRSVSQIRVASGVQYKEFLRVAEVIEEIEIAARMDAEGYGVQLAIDPVGYELFVEADRQLLVSAVSNLLQNAFKFSPRGTHVRMKVGSTAGRLSIAVEDECGGVPAESVEGLFLPFAQGGKNRTGLGLGLAISRRAIQTCGGDIHFSNRPGKGCVFSVDLPAASEDRVSH